MSTPKPPRAPNRFTAAMTSRPSPEPRSTTKSDGPTAASLSISSTTAAGVAANGAIARLSSAHAGAVDSAKASAAHAAAMADVILGAPMERESVMEGTAREMPVAITPPADTCRNCGAHATGHFCPNCGQETRVALPAFGAFMREAAGRYVAMDGRLWRTLAALVGRPGYLTQEYFAGRRKRYIRPARLFLVLYLLLFAVIGLLQSPLDLKDEVVMIEPDRAQATGPDPRGPKMAIVD